MNVFEYAIYRAGAQKMTPQQLQKARQLAAAGDAGEKPAAWLLGRMVRAALKNAATEQTRIGSAVAN